MQTIMFLIDSDGDKVKIHSYTIIQHVNIINIVNTYTIKKIQYILFLVHNASDPNIHERSSKFIHHNFFH